MCDRGNEEGVNPPPNPDRNPACEVTGAAIVNPPPNPDRNPACEVTGAAIVNAAANKTTKTIIRAMARIPSFV